MPTVNPDGTPGNVAANELIESAWGNATANTIGRFAAADADANVTIVGNMDASAAAMTDWLTTNITIPAWATKARIVTTLAGIVQPAGGASSFAVQLRLGATGGYILPLNPVATQRFNVAWCDVLALPATGVQVLAVMARNTFGGTVLRADAGNSVCKHVIRFDW